MKKFSLAFVSNSAEVGETVLEHSDPTLESVAMHFATMEEAVPVAKRLLAQGVEVIVGGNGTGRLLAQTIGQPVVKLERSFLDLVRAIRAAKRYSNKIAITTFGRPVSGIDILEELLAVNARQILFSNSSELESGIRDAHKAGFETVIGGGVCKELMTRLGGNGVIVVPDEEAVRGALREARAIATARRKDRKDAEETQTILHSVQEALIVLDMKGHVKILNHAAAEVFGLSSPGQRANLSGKPLPKKLNGLGLSEVLRSGHPEIERIRRVGDVDLVVSSFPIVIDGEIVGVVATFKETAHIQSIDRKVRERTYIKGFVAKHTLADFVGISPMIRELRTNVERYAKTSASILICGETGTGKEILAQSVHNLSPRRTSPFLAINCATLPEPLLESELFGYEEGAFTGAKRGGKIGLFELANHGTLFLDEIGDLPPTLQVKLLRVLEEKEIMRLGGDRIVPVDVRVLSAASRELHPFGIDSAFRSDLYFRLSTLRLDIPPLRQRVIDIPVILDSLLSRHGASPPSSSAAWTERLSAYSWPGNIRELDALVRRCIALNEGPEIDQRLFLELFDALRISTRVEAELDGVDVSGDVDVNGSLKDMVRSYERTIIQDTLRDCQFNRSEAAKRLGISMNSLWRKLPKGFTVPRFTSTRQN